ncbi:hypothetical protein [Pseudonocardia phyllosphaerae]|uniref:hypothetical protein n=1 Tax=Pseudonocardia phyllosphaerae TaxID=3390502 RepID=UPI00397C9E2E
MRRPEVVGEREVSRLEHLRQSLIDARGTAGEAEIAEYEAEREWLLDRIGDQIRRQRASDALLERLRAEIEEREAAAAEEEQRARRRPGPATAATQHELQQWDASQLSAADRSEPAPQAAEPDAAPAETEWFTPDVATPEGLRPLTGAEIRAVGDRIRATQAEATAVEDEDAAATAWQPRDDDVADAGWEREA